MAFDEEVYKMRRIVLVGFSRARVGSPQYLYPDLDDRGWLHDRAASNGETIADVHGPVLGMQQDRDAWVQCNRLRVESTANGGPELYMKSEDTSVVTLDTPAVGSPLPADGKFKLKGGTGTWSDKFARLTIRLDSDSGPIIGEMGARVFRQRTVRIQPWILTVRGRAAPGAPITGLAPATSSAQITTLINVAKRVWRQCGIRFQVLPTLPGNVTLTAPGMTLENSHASNSFPSPDGVMRAPGFDDSNPVHLVNRTANACNICWIRQFRDLNPGTGQTMAWAYDKTAWAAGSGIAIMDGADGNDLAHEIGHYLSLDHSDEPAGGSAGVSRTDYQVLRRLMFRFNPHGQGSFRRNVGYGSRVRGALITMRDKAKHFRDDEWFEARRRAVNPY
jgi:hypothetical protein